MDTSGVLAGKTLTQISAGGQHACVLDTAGRAYCWGVNFDGMLGDGTTTDSHVPVAVDTSGVLAGKKLTKLAGGGTATVRWMRGRRVLLGRQRQRRTRRRDHGQLRRPGGR